MELLNVTPVLRIFDVPLARSFYVDYLGCTVDWEEGDPPNSPAYLQVSRGPLVPPLDPPRPWHPGRCGADRGPRSPCPAQGAAWQEVPVHEPGINPFANLIRFFERGVDA
jgi:Glyoxalase superfamily protein